MLAWARARAQRALFKASLGVWQSVFIPRDQHLHDTKLQGVSHRNKPRTSWEFSLFSGQLKGLCQVLDPELDSLTV